MLMHVEKRVNNHRIFLGINNKFNGNTSNWIEAQSYVAKLGLIEHTFYVQRGVEKEFHP